MSASPDSFTHSSTPERNEQSPLHMKKRRITRACDLCRRRKIKVFALVANSSSQCDGSRPCASCSHSNAECTFSDQPKKRQPQKGQRYIETLEVWTVASSFSYQKRLERMESLLKGLVPEMESDFEGLLAEETAESLLLSAKAEKFRGSSLEPELLDVLSDSLVGMFHSKGEGKTGYFGSQSGSWFLLKAQECAIEYLPQHMTEDILSMWSAPSHPCSSTPPFKLAMLPTREIADIFVQAFLDNFNVAIPLFHAQTFLETYQNSWTNASVMLSRSWLATYLIVLALGCHADSFRRDNTLRQEFEAMARTWADAACGMRDELLDIGDSQAVRALLLIAHTDPNQLWWQLGAIVRCALGAGLHRSPHRLNLDAVQKQENCNLFWSIYIMDKTMSNLVGLPSLLQDEDIDQSLPDPIDYTVHTKDCSTEQVHNRSIDLFILIIKLARIQSQIQKKLYKIIRDDRDIAKLVEDIAELDKRIAEWREQLNTNFDLTHELPPAIHTTSLYAHFLAHHTLIILYRHGLLISIERTLRSDSLHTIFAAYPQLVAGSNLCVRSARATIQLLGSLPIDSIPRMCLFMHYPYLSALVVFTNIMRDPSHDHANSDILLIEGVISFVRQNCYCNDRPYLSNMAKHLAELVNVSRQVLAKVSLRKAKRPRDPDMSSAPEENCVAVESTAPNTRFCVSSSDSADTHTSEWVSSKSALPLSQCSYVQESLFNVNISGEQPFGNYEPSYLLGDIDWDLYPSSEATSYLYTR